MTADDFEVKLQELVHQANQEEIPIDDVYSRQVLIVETILRLSIEKAYKERFL